MKFVSVYAIATTTLGGYRIDFKSIPTALYSQAVDRVNNPQCYKVGLFEFTSSGWEYVPLPSARPQPTRDQIERIRPKIVHLITSKEDQHSLCGLKRDADRCDYYRLEVWTDYGDPRLCEGCKSYVLDVLHK